MTGPGERWRSVATSNSGEDYPRAFTEHFARLAAAGQDVHGEAAFVAGLLAPGARVLDAGCGTGRVGARLAELGFEVTGVDVDEAMVALARELHPDLRWVVSDLGALDLAEQADVVVLAGNVVPFLEPPDLPRVVQRLTAHLVAGGLLVSGFGLDRANLPCGVPVVPLEVWDRALADAGFTLSARHGGWDGGPFTGGYAVSVHRAPEHSASDVGGGVSAGV